MADAFFRFLQASGCATQNELAAFLKIRQASVAHAKKKRTVPAPWLLTLLREKGINPDWILTGRGARLLQPASGGAEECPVPAEELVIGALAAACVLPVDQQSILAACTAQELVNELVRRAIAAV